MKRRTVVVGLLAALVVAVVFFGGMKFVAAQDGGSVWKEIRRIASSEPERMVGALRYVRKTYQWKPGGKAEYDALFMGALKLEGYGANAIGVEQRERAKRALREVFDEDEVDTLIDGATLAPKPEDGEGVD